MQKTVTIGYANHRPESVPFALAQMYCHQAVFLEEPPDPGFLPMLDGELAVDEYLQSVDVEYPGFSRLLLKGLRRMHTAGKTIAQVEPYLEALIGIHERFADGGRPQDLAPDSLQRAVYASERRATAALLDFYQASTFDGFEPCVEAVKNFARADARRFILRDSLRAAALQRRVCDHETSYVEAGQIHLLLATRLRRDLNSSVAVRSNFLMTAAVRRLGGRRANLFGPGDRLTLLYVLHPGMDSATEDLLAARSLIYSKLIAKEELHPVDGDPFPHTRDELLTDIVVRKLALADCRKLFAEIRRLKTPEARSAVRRYLGPDVESFPT